MRKNYAEWTLYNAEEEVKKESFILFLQYILQNDNEDKVIEILKVSGYFISYRDHFEIKKAQIRRVDAFIKVNLGEEHRKLYKNLKKEASLLQKKRDKLDKYIDSSLEKYEITEIDLIRVTENYIKYFDDNIAINNEQIITTSEYYVFVLGILLKAIMYSKTTNTKKKIVPSFKQYTELFESTFKHMELNEVIKSWMFGNVKLSKRLGKLEIEEGLGRNKDRVVSSIRYLEIKEVKDMKSSLKKFYETRKYKDNLNIYEESLKDKIKEYFYTNDFQEKYLDVSLLKWMAAYKFFAKNAYEKEGSIISFQKEQIIKGLIDSGLSGNEASNVLECLIFRRKTKDLFDGFLIEKEGCLLFSSKMYLLIDPSRAIISLLGKAEGSKTAINQKGSQFEKHIVSLIKENKCVRIEENISINYKNEKYEIDLAFVLDNSLFICECKTQYQHENMRDYYRNLKELDVYLEKFKRNYKFFTESNEGMELIRQKLQLPCLDDFYPVFISNVVFMEQRIDEVYITDESRMFNYMKRIAPRIMILNEGCNLKVKEILFPEFYEGKINANQFIDFLNNKDNELEEERKKVVLFKNQTLDNLGISSKRYIRISHRQNA